MSGETIYKNLFAMGTRLDMVVPDIADDVYDGFALESGSVIKLLEDKISIYKNKSAFSLLNRSAYKSPQKIDKELFCLLKELLSLSERTIGYFDFTIGKMIEWQRSQAGKNNDYTEDGLSAAGFGWRNLALNEEEMTVEFITDKVFLDSGGFGKGLGLDALKKVLQTWRINSAFISFGESSIFAHGKHPFGKYWMTGVQNIFNGGGNVFVFRLHNEVLSVSAITPENMKKYGAGHIVNPISGRTIDTFLQAAVAGTSGLITEALSTALISSPEEAHGPIMEAFPDYRAVVIGYNENKNPVINNKFNFSS